VLMAIAAELGSDGPACLAARPVMAEGRGERLSPPPVMPILDAVLVNPRVPCSTGKVYRAYDVEPAGAADRPDMPATFNDVSAVLDFLARQRNDLERPALGVAPEIVTLLDALRAAPETRLARLSGSGATAFALCADDAAASALARRLNAERPEWWVQQCRFGGPWPDPA
ncbi:MAG: 4-(cytidine 5'-diphospho)-2-C-methyl-D-erythritol kinase, partial [Caulobacteraceae bacterium]